MINITKLLAISLCDLFKFLNSLSVFLFFLVPNGLGYGPWPAPDVFYILKLGKNDQAIGMGYSIVGISIYFHFHSVSSTYWMFNSDILFFNPPISSTACLGIIMDKSEDSFIKK